MINNTTINWVFCIILMIKMHFAYSTFTGDAYTDVIIIPPIAPKYQYQA